MINVNSKIRKKYYELLSTICPSFYMEAPSNVRYDAYIIFSSISNKNISNKSSTQTEVSVTVKIYTVASIINDGDKGDIVATSVYNLIKSSPDFNIELEGGLQCYQTTVENDVVGNAISKGNFVFIDRFITFTHKIKIN